MVSTLIALALLRPFGVIGVVAGAATAAWIECVLLGHALGRRLDGLDLARLPLVKLLVLGVACAAPGYGLKIALGNHAHGFVGAFAILAAVGLGFAIASPALGLFDWRQLLRRR